MSDSDSDSDSVVSDRPPLDMYVEEGELSDDQDATITDPDQSLSEEQTYRESMTGIRSTLLAVRRQVSTKISLSNRPDHKQNGKGFTPTSKRIILIVCLPGIQTHPD